MWGVPETDLSLREAGTAVVFACAPLGCSGGVRFFPLYHGWRLRMGEASKAMARCWCDIGRVMHLEMGLG